MARIRPEKPTELTKYHEPGSLPLHTHKQERYAQERSLFNSPQISARNAGYNGHSNDIAFQLERKPSIKNRIAFLCRDAESALHEKRKRLETFLWDAIEVDRSKYYETVEIIITDRNGMPVLGRDGKPKTREITQLKALEHLNDAERRLIESISYTESGKPNLKLVGKEFAHRELRRMLGGDKEQGVSAGSTFSGFTDAELFAELGRLANQLGIKTTLTIEPDASPVLPHESKK